jgi:dipeptidyl aminopeptidase/acylaminoacyl peptidase
MSQATPLNAEDLYRFRWLDHVRLSPDGRRVAWQEGFADREARENRSVVVVAPTDGGEARRLTADDQRSRLPEWSPDGRSIAFLVKKGAVDQLGLVPADGGEVRVLTSLPDGVRSFRWSPDGAALSFLARVPAEEDGVVEDERPPKDPDAARRPPVARIARTLAYKFNGEGYFDGRRVQLFVLALDGGEPRRLTEGAWDVDALAFSPDGRTLAVIGDDRPDEDLHLDRLLWTVDIRSGERRELVTGMLPSAVTWSPTGDHLAFSAPTQAGTGYYHRIWLVSRDGGAPRCLTPELDRDIAALPVSDVRGGSGGELRWDEAGQRLWFTAGGPGSAILCSVGTDGTVREEVTRDEAAIADFDVRDGTIAALISDPANPGDVAILDGDAERRLTDANPWLRDRWVSLPERHLFTAEDGLAIEGWLLKPPGFDPNGSYPMVLQIHGGPHGQYGWVPFHEFQVLAGKGFCVLYTNPRGSNGYGEEFCRACIRDWGGADYKDLMSAVDQLLEKSPFIDPQRLGVAGGSYGGFMTNWIVGHTRRFNAAVSMRSISNLVSDYAQNDIVLWSREEMGPEPWANPDRLWQNSPIRYVDDMRTPMLLIHAEMDLRCPISQSEELFGALRLLGREVEMVRFPGENHELSRGGRPDRRVERLRRIEGWFTSHLMPTG